MSAPSHLALRTRLARECGRAVLAAVAARGTCQRSRALVARSRLLRDEARRTRAERTGERERERPRPRP